MRHVSIDLETLGKGHDAAITQLGWCPFDPTTGVIGTGNAINVSPTCGVIDPSTVVWWLQQGEDARMGMVTAIDTGVTLAQGLRDFGECLYEPEHAMEGVCVWGNGATFDITILESAYSRCGLVVPWMFYNVRDMRTIVHLAQDLRGFNRASVVRAGVHHDAAADAAHQARVITAAWQALK